MKNFFKDIFQLSIFLTRRDKQKVLVLFLLMLFAALLDALGIVAVPVFIALVMDPSTLTDNRWIGGWFEPLPEIVTIEILIWASGFFIAFTILKNLFLSVVFYVQSKIIVAQRIRLSDRMFSVYQQASYEWLLQRGSSEMLRNIENDTFQVTNGVFLPFMDLVMAIIMSIVIVITLLLSTPSIILLGLCVTALGLIVIVRLFQGRLKRTGEIIRNENNELIKSIQEGFGALVDSRIIGCEEYLNKVHKESLVRQGEALVDQTVLQKITPYAVETFAFLGLLLTIVCLIGIDSVEGVLPIIALIGMATMRLKQVVSSLASSINKINAGRAYIPGIVNDLRDLDEVDHRFTSEHPLEGEQESSCFKVLSLDNVGYSYPDAGTQALNNVTLEIYAGESVAFVGPSGCGKSTLINLLLGLLEPQDGSISFNQKDIYQNLQAWRHHLGYIPQTIYIIDDTIRSNIAFGVQQEDVDDAQLWNVIRLARLEEFINGLPMGLNTVVGERGARLSGGQRQRIGIARALYPNPDVLVMDEATSALDNKMEAEVMQAIEGLKYGRTLIMIAHRLTTVESCDRLYLLQHGEIHMSGSYREMEKNSAKFRELAMLGKT